MIFNDDLLLMILLGFFLDLFIGDPVYPLHPVRIIGNYIISPMEKLIRKHGFKGRNGGFILVVSTLSISTGFVILIDSLISNHSILLALFNTYLIYSLVAVKDLLIHCRKIRNALKTDDIDNARKLLSMVVGRETRDLDRDGISRACVETLAENLSDGILAPLFYVFTGGVLLMIFYKAVNTMDSMIGYKDEKYFEFGYYPAKLDDIMNWIPSRITMVFIMLAGFMYSGDWKRAWKVAIANRKHHASPNAGFPEAAMAAVLDLRLGGPGWYHGILVEKPYINKNGKNAVAEDTEKAEKIVMAVSILFVFVFSIIGIYL